MASEPEGPAPQSSGNAPQRDSAVPTAPYGGAPYGGSVPGGSVLSGTAPGGSAPQPGEPWDEWNPGDEPTRPLRGRHRVARQRTGGVARGGAVLGVGMIAAVGASGMATAHDKDPGSISVPDLGDVTDAVDAVDSLDSMDELSDRLPTDTEDLPALGAPATDGTATTNGTAPADGTVAAAAHRTAPDTPATADSGDAGNALLARLLAQAGAAPRDGAAETPAEPAHETAHETAAEAPQVAPAATVGSADTDGSAADGRADGPANRPADGPADGPAHKTAPVSEQPSEAPEKKQEPAPAPATDASPATSTAADTDATTRTEPAPATTGATTGTASDAAATKGTYTKPLASYRLSAGFGQAGNMWQSEHTGQDFTAPNGTPVKAVHAGTVKAAGWAGSYGYRVVLRLEDGTEVWFCHLSSMTKSAGDKVATGEVIGRVGSTGTSSGPHLHVEVRPDGGAPVDPLPWLHERGVEV
ncbi:peptidoglycan DD-metalloendopeptidase family protein [Streptomyces albus]|uniref:M23 family metallopeptidase n=1 Tax=Streptomyces albus TaxID=1888 RepID=UPI0024AE08B6|nr:peptidoglycan DD-metalloendopeptidase family protein [Streptomyces albus]MDI6411915.1 peptidoglycan DD-metalloendopeptidase family protein [Streptomyces albus]